MKGTVRLSTEEKEHESCKLFRLVRGQTAFTFDALEAAVIFPFTLANIQLHLVGYKNSYAANIQL